VGSGDPSRVYRGTALEELAADSTARADGSRTQQEQHQPRKGKKSGHHQEKVGRITVEGSGKRSADPKRHERGLGLAL